mgnify:CR=1 FL=1
MFSKIRPFIFKLDPELAHDLAIKALKTNLIVKDYKKNELILKTKLFGKEIGNDFYEGKVTLPIILLNQKANADEKKDIKSCFLNNERSEEQFKSILRLIKKYEIINECYSKADYFISLSSNSLSIFPETKEKEILKKLTSFSLERNF